MSQHRPANSARIARLGAVMALAAAVGCGLTEPRGLEMMKTAGDDQVGPAATELHVSPSVLVLDATGEPRVGVPVTFSVIAGDGTIPSAPVVTNDSGIAVAGPWKLGKAVGVNSVEARARGVNGRVTFEARSVVGAPATILVTAGADQRGVPGATVDVPPSVTVVDAGGNGVAGVHVTFAAALGAGTATGTEQLTDGHGLATVGTWTLGPKSGVNTMSVVSGLLTAQIRATAVATTATKLEIIVQPAGSVDGAPLSTQPQVAIEDAVGNLVPGATTIVTASILSGDGTLTGSTSVAAVQGVATFTNLGLDRSTAATLRFSAAGLSAATSRPVSGAPSSAFNLAIDGMYVTQVTQSYDGSVPLIAGRAGLVRVFVKASAMNSVAPMVRVRTYANGALLRTYMIPSPSSSTPLAIDESKLGASWNVTIPAIDMNPGLSIVADIDPSTGVTETSTADNSFPRAGTTALSIRVPAPFLVTLVPVSQPGIAAGDVTNPTSYLDYASRVFPITSTNVAVHAPYAFNGVLSKTYDVTWGTLLSEIDALRIVEGATRTYYGVAHPAHIGGATGLGRMNAPAAVGLDLPGPNAPNTTMRATIAAHEWGHNFGRLHVNCGGATDPDPTYPYAGTTTGAYGWDALAGELRAPSGYADMMSYCDPPWISDYTYKAVMAFREAHSDPAYAAQRGLLVWGHIGADGIAVLEPSFEVNAPPALPHRAGPNHLQATDAMGRNVFDISFDGDAIDHLPGERIFSFVVPLFGNAMPSTLRLSAGGRTVSRQLQVASAGADDAARLTPAASGRNRLEWNAAAYPMAMVRDAVTGEVLTFARGGSATLPATASAVVLFSNGVTSVRHLVRVTPK